LRRWREFPGQIHDPAFFGQASGQSQFSGSGIFQKAGISDVAAMLKAGNTRICDKSADK